MHNKCMDETILYFMVDAMTSFDDSEEVIFILEHFIGVVLYLTNK